MIQPINSPLHQQHADGLAIAIEMRNTAYKPDPAPVMRRTLPYCDCDMRICPVCYPPNQVTSKTVITTPSHNTELVDTGTFAEICERYPVGKLQGVEKSADGWIKWSGGECPIPGVLAGEFSLKMRGGEEHGAVCDVDADQMYWGNDGRFYDIIAYRLHDLRLRCSNGG